MKFNYKPFLFYLPVMYLLVCLFSSCSENKVLIVFNRSKVKNYPSNKPFVFENEIVVRGNITKDEKKRLTTDLENYWDDSLRVPRLQKWIFFYSIKKPPVFDSINIDRTKKFMNSYLNSQGYYYANIKDSVPPFDTVKNDQVRATINMTIDVGKNIKIDSVGFDLADSNHHSKQDSALQLLAIQSYNKSFLKKGEPYTKQIIAKELDRLVNLFRQNGYYRFTRDDIYALIDTTDQNLLTLTLDPFEQTRLLAMAAKRRKENPTWNVFIKQKPLDDSSEIHKFYVDSIYYYPETRITDVSDSLVLQRNFKEEKYHDITLRYQEGKFRHNPLVEYTALRHDSLYNETLYLKTISNLGKLGAWQQVDSKIIVNEHDSLDLYFFLVPAAKQNYTIDLEGSRNTGDITSGNLLGISTSLSYRNRNVWKQAIQSVTSIRFGTEFNLNQFSADSGRTFQVSLSHTYSFPKLILPRLPFLRPFLSKIDNKRTLFTTSASYTNRTKFYKLRNLSTSWGYEWSNGNNNWTFKPLNIELYKVDTLNGLITLFNQNPFLRNSFRNGNVVGSTLGYSKAFLNRKNPRESHLIRLNFEESGTLLSLFNKIGSQVFDYVKMESEYVFNYKFRKTELATRFFAGAVLPKSGQTVPAFKQYFLGGPNSMRAWDLRQLGLGSSILSDTSQSGYSDRFGNLSLEANIEYRFTLWDAGSFKIGSALYSDIGNVWNFTKDSENPNAEFSLPRLGKDIAIGIGTGLRFDFTYFLIRLDFAYKVKDPARQYNNGWMDLKKLTWNDTRMNGKEVNNYAVQFGINLPF
jgi:outer membrane protein insertion porin family